MKQFIKERWKVKIDERQQADLNRVNSYGFYIAYYLLLGYVLVKAVILKCPPGEWVGEWAIFMILAVYEIIACMKIGVWTQHRQKPEKKDYLIYSLAGSLFFSVVFAAGNWLRWDPLQKNFGNLAITFLTWFAELFVLLMIGLFAGGAVFNHRRKKMEEKLNQELLEEEDEDE